MSSLTFFFFFNDTATTEIYTLSLHDALPIWQRVDGDDRRARTGRAVGAQRHHPEPLAVGEHDRVAVGREAHGGEPLGRAARDRKSTRLNSSHANISYAVFCLKKKKKSTTILQ